MARPQKKGLDYFPFDVDFFFDEKIVAIAGEFGIKGEIVAVKLLCAVYRNGYFIEWSEMLQMMLLRNLPGISAELLNQIVKRLVLWGFFDKTLFDSANILTSRGIQNRFFKGTQRRIQTDDTPYLLIDFPEKRVSAYNNGVSAYRNPAEKEFLYTKTTQSKVKENKKKTTTNVVVKEKATPPSVSIKEEIDFLKAETIWLNNMTILHHADVSTLIAKLDDFYIHCMAEGKESHDSIKDAKSHFNSWLRIQKQEETKKQNGNKTNNARRRGTEITATSADDYKTSF